MDEPKVIFNCRASDFYKTNPIEVIFEAWEGYKNDPESTLVTLRRIIEHSDNENLYLEDKEEVEQLAIMLTDVVAHWDEHIETALKLKKEEENE